MPAEPRHPARNWALIGAATLLTLPALLMRVHVFGSTVSPGTADTLLFGTAILGAAFLLSWAAEVAELDISQGLAIAFLAFVAVLPEYAVDLVFAWKAGRQDSMRGAGCGHDLCRSLSIANMTGANRLLIGLGWATVVLVWWWRSRERSVTVAPARRTDLGALIIATVWGLVIVARGSLSLLDTGVLFAIFALYGWHVLHEEGEEPDLVGPPVAIAALRVRARRIVTLVMFLWAAGLILASAEPFSHGLVLSAQRAGLSPFLAVQWLAPVASEAPEMIIAVLLVLRAKPQAGLGALVSSKVQQWTLLVGTIPIVYGIAYGSLTHGLRLDGRQVEEVLLTAAQSLFACAVLGNLRISRWEAVGLMVLFAGQLADPSTAVRFGFAAAYGFGCIAILVAHAESRRGLFASVRRALSKPRADAS